MQVGAGGGAHWHCNARRPRRRRLSAVSVHAAVCACIRQRVISDMLCLCGGRSRLRRRPPGLAGGRLPRPARLAGLGGGAVLGRCLGGLGGPRAAAAPRAARRRSTAAASASAISTPRWPGLTRGRALCAGGGRRRSLGPGGGRSSAARCRSRADDAPDARRRRPSIRRWPSRMLASSRSERSRAARSASSPCWISARAALELGDARLQLAARRAAPPRARRRPPARPPRAGAAGPPGGAPARARRARSRSAAARAARLLAPALAVELRPGDPRPRRAAAARRTRAA